MITQKVTKLDQNFGKGQFVQVDGVKQIPICDLMIDGLVVLRLKHIHKLLVKLRKVLCIITCMVFESK